MLNKLLNKIYRNQKGITGLETAIILIAFVVVASVFAYTVLSAGIFSSQKGKEAVYSGLEQARASLTFKGSVVGTGTATALPDEPGHIEKLVFIVANALEGEPIDLTPPTDTAEDGLADPNSANVTVISYLDKTQRVDDIAWTAVPLGKHTAGGNILGTGDKFEITVDLIHSVGGVEPYTTFSLEIKPPKGSVLVIERTTPAAIYPVMTLN
jgi:flagellin FlaB